MLDAAIMIVDDHAVTDGVKNGLELTGFYPQTEVGRLQFLYLLLDFGIEADLRAFQPKQPFEIRLVNQCSPHISHVSTTFRELPGGHSRRLDVGM
jgi:hypothetical protein